MEEAELYEIKEIKFISKIGECIRCGEDHGDMDFKSLSNSIDEYRWWCLCPKTHQPVIMTLDPDSPTGTWER